MPASQVRAHGALLQMQGLAEIHSAPDFTGAYP